MELILTRIAKRKTYTIGRLAIRKEVNDECKNKLVGQVVDSRIWLHRLKQKIVEAKERGEAVWITIK